MPRVALVTVRRSSLTPTIAAGLVVLSVANGCGYDAIAPEEPAAETNVSTLATAGMHGFMIVSEADPTLALNAYGGAVANGPVKLYRGCTWDNPACTWTYRHGALLSDDTNNALGIRLAASAPDNDPLILSGSCAVPLTAPAGCKWYYRDGRFINEDNHDFAIGVTDGPSHGSVVKGRDACTSSTSAKCRWSIQSAMITPSRQSGWAMRAVAATDRTRLTLSDSCSRTNPECTFTFRKGQIVSDVDPTLFVMASEGPHNGAWVRLFKDACNDFDDDLNCKWMWKSSKLYHQDHPEYALLAVDGLVNGAPLTLRTGDCPSGNKTCVYEASVAGPQCGHHYQGSCDGVTCEEGFLARGLCLPVHNRTIRCPASGDLVAGDVSGNLYIGISNTGNWSVKGHAHDTGLFGMNYTMGFTFDWSVAGGQFGQVHSGVVHGTLDIGSRDDNFEIGGKDTRITGTDGNLVPNWETFARSPVRCNMRSSVNPWLVAEAALIGLGLVTGAGLFLLGIGQSDHCEWQRPTDNRIDYVCSE